MIPLVLAFSFLKTYAETDWSVSADFLYWYASEEIASIWADVITSTGNKAKWEAPSFDFGWDPGFRVGLGHTLPHDKWDTALYWTWYRTSATHKLSSAPDTTLRPEFFAAFLSGDTPRKMEATWALLFNMFDWELGRLYSFGTHFDLRPFIGVKGGWIRQSINVKYSDLIIDFIFQTDATAKEHVKNNFWGVSPMGGIDTTWKLCNCRPHFFNIFGDFQLATMWGSWTCGDAYEDTLGKTSSVNMKNSALGALMLRGIMGLGWDLQFRENQPRFSIKLGYEMQLWLNQLRIATFQLQRLHNDLTLQGLTLNCRLDF